MYNILLGEKIKDILIIAFLTTILMSVPVLADELAHQAGVTATTSEVVSGFGPERLIDGIDNNSANYWQSGTIQTGQNTASSTTPSEPTTVTPQYVQINFPTQKTFNRIVFSENAARMRTYTISVSDNGTDWTPVKNGKTIRVTTAEQVLTETFEPVTASKVRLTITSVKATVPVAQIQEIYIYNDEVAITGIRDGRWSVFSQVSAKVSDATQTVQSYIWERADTLGFTSPVSVGTKKDYCFNFNNDLFKYFRCTVTMQDGSVKMSPVIGPVNGNIMNNAVVWGATTIASAADGNLTTETPTNTTPAFRMGTAGFATSLSSCEFNSIIMLLNNSSLTKIAVRGGYIYPAYTTSADALFYNKNVSGNSVFMDFAPQSKGELYFLGTPAGQAITIKEVLVYPKVNITENNGVLTALYGGWESGAAAYTWYRADSADAASDNWVQIDGANESDYLVKTSDVNQYIMVKADLGNGKIATSLAHTPSSVRALSAAIEGKLSVNNSLAIKLNTTAFDDIESVKWYSSLLADGSNPQLISDNLTYVITNGVVGKYIFADVTLKTGEIVKSAVIGPMVRRAFEVIISGENIVGENLSNTLNEAENNEVDSVVWERADSVASVSWQTVGNNLVYTTTNYDKNKYIRAVVSLKDGSNSASLPVLINDLLTKNLALRKTVTISSGTGVNNVTDGDETTIWYSKDYNNTTDNGKNEWVYIDFGTIQSFDTIGVTQHGDRIKKYRFQTSSDGNEWADVYSGTGPTGWSTCNFTVTLDRLISTRYLRLYIDSCNSSTTASGVLYYVAGVKEMSVRNSGAFSKPAANMFNYNRNDAEAEITAQYEYIQSGGKLESGSAYAWYSSEDGISWTAMQNKTGECSSSDEIKLLWNNDMSGKYIKLAVTLASANVITKNVVEKIWGPMPTMLPVVPNAFDVKITGNAFIGNTITGSYTYSDRNGDAEQGSIYKWLCASDINSLKWSELAKGSCNASSQVSYLIKGSDADKYIKLEITPKSNSNELSAGAPAYSAVALIYGKPQAKNVYIGGNKTSGGTLEGLYEYYHPNGLQEKGSTYKWYKNGALTNVATQYYADADAGSTYIFEVIPACDGNLAAGDSVKSSAITVSKEEARGGSGGGGSGGKVSFDTKTVIQNTLPEENLLPAFSDVSGHWAEKDIIILKNAKIVNGSDDNMFKPEQKISRAEFIALIVRTIGMKSTADEQIFTDVTKTDWFFEAVSSAAQNNIISKDNSFRPGEIITREEIAKILITALMFKTGESYGGTDLKFSDKNEISDWALDYVSAAVEKGIITGMPEGTFEPKDSASRAEAAVVLSRLYKLVQIKNGGENN